MNEGIFGGWDFKNSYVAHGREIVHFVVFFFFTQLKVR